MNSDGVGDEDEEVEVNLKELEEGVAILPEFLLERFTVEPLCELYESRKSGSLVVEEPTFFQSFF